MLRSTSLMYISKSESPSSRAHSDTVLPSYFLCAGSAEMYATVKSQKSMPSAIFVMLVISLSLNILNGFFLSSLGRAIYHGGSTTVMTDAP